MAKFAEHNLRSIAKTVTYRVLIIVSTFVIVFIITGRLDLTIGITFAANVVNMFLYYLHERAWNKIHWGKKKA